MIVVYDAKESEFDHNGLAVLDNCIRAEVEEELNNYYGLELEYPIIDTKVQYLIEDNIIKAPTPTGLQLFRIYRKVKSMSSVICYARHIFYDLLDNFIESYRTGNVDGNTALQGILNNTQYKLNFNGYSNVNTIGDAFYVRKNPIAAIIGEDKNSFLNRWGGEILRDNFNISILNGIGADKGVTISYGKNLLGVEEDLDMSEVVTRIMPTGLTEDDQTVILPEKYINSPNINKYPFPKVKHLHFGDIKIDPEGDINTLEDVYMRLRYKCMELYYQQHIDIPKANYKVDFVELSKTEEYKNYKCLETVSLGDIVIVKHKKLDIDIRQKVIKYKWDSLLNKYLEIELGSFKDDLSTDLNDINNSLDDIRDSIEDSKKQFRSTIDKQDDRITLAVEEIGKTNTKLELTANSITADVEDKINKTNSKIEQTASNIRSEVNEEFKATGSHLQNLYGEVTKANSKIEQTATEITSKINIDYKDLDGKISSANSKIEQTATSIRTEVKNTKDNLESKIEQTAGNIKLEVNGYTDSSMSSAKSYAYDKMKDAKDYAYDQADSARREAISSINVQAGRIDVLSNKININGTYFYPNGTIKTEGLRGDLIKFDNGYDIDTRGDGSTAGIRLRYDSTNYIKVSNGAFNVMFPDGSGGSQSKFEVTPTGARIRVGGAWENVATTSSQQTIVPKFG